MSKLITIFLCIVSLLTACSGGKPVDYVDPFIGTGGHGHTYPGATVPFGAVQLSPDNYRGVWDACSGYHYDRDSIIGFSHTHLSGTGCADLADVLFHPTTMPAILGRGEGDVFEHYRYSHKNETARPGYYSVLLEGEGIKAELTATAHTGWHRYTYRPDRLNSLIIDLHHQITDEKIFESDIRLTGSNEISGMRLTQSWVPDQHIFFVAQFSKDIKNVQYIDDGKAVSSADECRSVNRQAVLAFEDDGEPLVAKVGLSIVSADNAKSNLEAETGDGFDFDAVENAAGAAWNELLSRVKVSGGTDRDKRLFYTALYHTAVAPNITSDVNGQFRRNNGQVAEDAPWGNSYSTLSFWDTFRSWLPLSTLVYPDILHDIVFSSLDMYDAQGELPIWPLSSGETKCMIGYHSVPFIVDAYLKGLVPDLDADKALDAMVKSSNINGKGSELYTSMGYIPNEKERESVSCVLEYAYDDWAIAQFAKFIGREDVADEYFSRAGNYVNLFDGRTGFFRGRKGNGLWVEPFKSFESTREYTEATPWQYRFFVPQDFYGLSQLFGGRDQLEAAVDETFTTTTDISSGVSDITGMIGQYAHGNEPSHHISYIYNYLGKPWKTQELTARIMDEMYDDAPDGLSGNEDCGQMSAWYVMSAIGLYDVCPGSGQFNLTAPKFPKTVISLPGGRKLTLRANASSKNKYIDSIELNGKTVDKNYISYEELMDGGEMKFILSSEPNRSRGTSPEAAPYSLSTSAFVSSPYYDAHGQSPDVFLDSIVLSLGCRTEGAIIRFTTDGSAPDENSEEYAEPLHFTQDALVRAKAFKEGFKPSNETLVSLKRAFAEDPEKSSYDNNGVDYSYFTGAFTKTSQIVACGHFVKKGTLPSVSLDPAEQEDAYGFVFSGFIRIPEEGLWIFATRSDDGSTLQIGKTLVVDNDGSHSASYQEGSVLLKKGFYPFVLKYLEDSEGQELQWFWQAPSEEEVSAVPDDCIFVK